MLSLLHSSFSLSNKIVYKTCFLFLKTMILALLPSLLHLHDLLKVALLMLITYCLVDNPANLISAQVMHLDCKNPVFQMSSTKFNATCKLFTNHSASLTQGISQLLTYCPSTRASGDCSFEALIPDPSCTIHMPTAYAVWILKGKSNRVYLQLCNSGN